jgi:hypothetical protein
MSAAKKNENDPDHAAIKDPEKGAAPVRNPGNANGPDGYPIDNPAFDRMVRADLDRRLGPMYKRIQSALLKRCAKENCASDTIIGLMQKIHDISADVAREMYVGVTPSDVMEYWLALFVDGHGGFFPWLNHDFLTGDPDDDDHS